MKPGWTEVLLGELVESVATIDPRDEFGNNPFTYIDLSAVDRDRKCITATATLIGNDAPSRARQLLRHGDVLVSTVRPNLNAVAMTESEHDGAVGSTGFTVLRPNGALDGRYLFQWVRTRGFVASLARKATGASYPAVSDRIVKAERIPLPPVHEQERIARILDHVQEITERRSVAIKRVDSLAYAQFLATFGDPETNPFDWDVGPLSDFVSVFVGGRSFAGHDDDDLAAPYRVLRVSAVTSGEFRPDQSRPVPRGYEPPTHHFVQRGDLLISRANTSELVGAVALVDDPPDGLLLPDKIWRFVWHDADAVVPEFVWQLFQTRWLRRQISRRATGTSGSMKNISAEKLARIEVIRPPLIRQREFARVFHRMRGLRAQARDQRAQLDVLFASLQHRAFTGQL